VLYRAGQAWIEHTQVTTDADGRAALAFDTPPPADAFRLAFDVLPYFQSQGRPSFYATITIDFVPPDVTQKYHVPLLLSPYGYSTYRGS